MRLLVILLWLSINVIDLKGAFKHHFHQVLQSFKRRTLNKKKDNPDRNLDRRSKSEKVRSRSKIYDRDPTFSDFDPARIAIGGRIENRIETISNPIISLNKTS